MEMQDKRAMESLSLFCHLAGLFSVFIGLAIGLFDLLNKDKTHIPVAVYIFFSGYANVKISNKLAEILNREQ